MRVGMMDPAMPGMIQGPYVMGPYVMGGAPALRAAPHHAHMPQLHNPHWNAQGMAAPGLPLPGETRKILPLKPDIQRGVFAAVTDRIEFIAEPQKNFLGERVVFAFSKVGANALATLVQCSLFSVGAVPQTASLDEFNIEDLTGTGLDLNMKMDPGSPGIKVSFQLFLRGPAFVPGTDSITVSGKIYGRTIG